ncbi:hypothetical protein E4U54_005128 [Claviceps lovelessii]|nr:hypothetical protein E4U54_005128 [Claviceps lovelessii]
MSKTSQRQQTQATARLLERPHHICINSKLQVRCFVRPSGSSFRQSTSLSIQSAKHAMKTEEAIVPSMSCSNAARNDRPGNSSHPARQSSPWMSSGMSNRADDITL